MLRASRSALVLAALLTATGGLAAQDAPGDDELDDRPPAEDTEDGVVVVTAARHDTTSLDTPYAVSQVDQAAKLGTGDGRSLPNSLAREPSVLLQKTSPGQSSPFIRGFTGYQTLWLVDGIRLNNSVWRSGPNQYSSTVDQFAVEKLELVRGPGSVLWGSDAVGGTINALSRPASAADGWRGGYAVRWASAERSLFNRLEMEGGQEGEWAVRAGVTDKRFGTIRAGNGSGDLRGTDFDERDYDARFDAPLDDGLDLTLGFQSVRQDDVPRTHRTVKSVSFHSTTVGSELRRDLDQKRDLAYARLSFEGQNSFYDSGQLTTSYQRTREAQERERTGGRFDRRSFDVQTLGFQFDLASDTDAGLLTYGIDYYRDEVDSFRKDYVDGVSTGDQIQGNIGDDSKYDRLGVFVQDEFSHGDHDTTLGLRWTYARARSNRVDNPNVDGSDPATPGNILTVDESWTNLVASARTLRHLSEDSALYAGVSQGFRAPNLSDLTSDLEDSGVEQPTPNLDPEYFVSLEVGAKAEKDQWSGDVALYYTWIRDLIVQSPTGEVVDGTPVQQKDNVGDGYVRGVEVRGERRFGDHWSAYAVGSWQDGRVDQFRPNGNKTRRPITRLMPLTGTVGVRYQADAPANRDVGWWVESDVLMADKADQLAFRDETDTERIPPGGTPGYGVLGVRGGVPLGESSLLTLAVENVFDKDYRVHGSGQNEPGRNLVCSYRVRF